MWSCLSRLIVRYRAVLSAKRHTARSHREIKRAVNSAVKGEIGRFPIIVFHALYKLLDIGITYRKLLTLYFRKLLQLVKVFIIMEYQLGFHFTIVCVSILEPD